MGLAAPRKRTKISHDPNNTNWSRSTSGFGHRILSSQGWTPGSFLGAQNAAHANMFTAASATHIKVTLKDDTLGLGAKPRRDLLNEPTGLDAFKGLLGRLNGKSDTDLEAEQRKRDDVKLARYAATKWQTVRFISGGMLVQEKINVLTTECPSKAGRKDTVSKEARLEKGEGLSGGKIRSDTSDSQSIAPPGKSSKKKASKASKSEDEKSSKSKKKRSKEKSKKRKHTSESESSSEEPSRVELEDSVKEDRETVYQKTTTAPSKERLPMGRHIFRGRHIAQKRRALLDDKSLNEIFMVKS